MNVRNIGKLKIPNSLFAENRTKILERMRNLGHKDGQIFLQGGKLQDNYDVDLELDFLQESYFMYLFGYDGDGAWGSIDLKTGETTLFLTKLSDAWAVWIGYPKPLSFYAEKYGMDHVLYSEEIPKKLEGETLYILDGLNSDSKHRPAPVKFPGIESFKIDKEVLYDELQECRVIKSEAELEIYKQVVAAGAATHIKMMKECKAGMKEYELEAVYRYHMLKEFGCRYFSFPPIIGCGPTSSTLHYFANKGTCNDGELVLCDIGLDYSGFKSDITITFPVNGKFTDDQKILYNTVLKANRAVIDKIKEGTHWTDMHTLTYNIILEGMVELGVLEGDIGEMIEADVGYCFMPHGLGHFLGMSTHDVGGYNKYTPEREEKKGWSSLRTARVMKEGMLITVEPGCYFNPVLIEQYIKDPKTTKFFVVDKIKQYYGFGGVRIEDDIFVTKRGCINLSEMVPRTVEEIEKVMSGEE